MLLTIPHPTNTNSGSGSGTVAVTAGTGCGWTAVANATWIHVTSGASGSANRSVAYSVDANPSSLARSGNGTLAYSVAPYTAKPKKRNGTLTIAGQTLSVTQTK